MTNFYPKDYDVIVVGGGHAGTEACLASARMGLSTLLVTHSIDTLGQMSCNPAIGGIGKGHLVKEIDAMGGLMGIAADHSGIQFRILNSSKGPAVRATRAQIDRELYKKFVVKFLEDQENLDIFQQEVTDLELEDNKVVGINTKIGIRVRAKSIVLTTGTFLNGKIHVGMENYSGGRLGDPASISLSKKLHSLDLRIGRLKTGTPPRLDARTIDFSKLQIQSGDENLPIFSFIGNVDQHPRQIACHMAYTNERTHQVIRNNLHRSAMYSGLIEGIGPRYCPSIEDKIVRFADKDRHQIFIEPEGLNTTEIYPNGLSTSLPFDVQVKYITSMEGLENARIMRPGYAIEYDYFDPRDLKTSLETKDIDSLFFAGQINGTTGYEEAAAQGLLAGINAGLKVLNKEPWCPKRSESYIGVLIDDLTTLGTKEPYRLFTSRAEYRLLLREDNADLRLTEKAHELGLITPERWNIFTEKKCLIQEEQERINKIWVHPNSKNIKKINSLLSAPLSKESNGFELLKRPDMSYSKLVEIEDFIPAVGNKQVEEQIEIHAKYKGYIDRQIEEIQKLDNTENIVIPDNFKFDDISGLSNEVKSKLQTFRPQTIGQASRISGITPAAISILLVYLKKHSQLQGHINHGLIKDPNK